jgi:hypothetical protein
LSSKLEFWDLKRFGLWSSFWGYFFYGNQLGYDFV